MKAGHFSKLGSVFFSEPPEPEPPAGCGEIYKPRWLPTVGVWYFRKVPATNDFLRISWFSVYVYIYILILKWIMDIHTYRYIYSYIYTHVLSKYTYSRTAICKTGVLGCMFPSLFHDQICHSNQKQNFEASGRSGWFTCDTKNPDIWFIMDYVGVHTMQSLPVM